MEYSYKIKISNNQYGIKNELIHAQSQLSYVKIRLWNKEKQGQMPIDAVVYKLW